MGPATAADSAAAGRDDSGPREQREGVVSEADVDEDVVGVVVGEAVGDETVVVEDAGNV